MGTNVCVLALSILIEYISTDRTHYIEHFGKIIQSGNTRDLHVGTFVIYRDSGAPGDVFSQPEYQCDKKYNVNYYFRILVSDVKFKFSDLFQK